MSQKEIVLKTKSPVTQDSLVQDLLALGLEKGRSVIVHSSLSSIGWVSGGAHAVVQALMEVVGFDGIIVMPTHSSGLSEPSYWKNPAVPEEWWPIIRETMTPFDPQLTPTEYMGAIPELFRNVPDSKRSIHPSNSFAAWGKRAEDFVSSQKLEFSMSDDSPLGKLYEDGAKILLIGVGHDSNTSLHLAETRITNFPIHTEGGPISINGVRKWKTFEDFDYNSSDFEKIGHDFELKHKVEVGKVGAAEAKLFDMKIFVDFAFNWIRVNRRFEY